MVGIDLRNGEGRWSTLSRFWEWGGLAVILLATSALRIRLLDVPLDRDEGHYAYVGQILLGGHLPYESAYTYFFPGVYGAFAAIMSLFGESVRGIHTGLLLMNLATIVLLYALARRLFGPIAALGAAASFAFAAGGRNAGGYTANAEHFVLFPALAGLLAIVAALQTRRRALLVLGALLLGVSATMKQHGVFFVGFGAIVVLAWELRRSSKRSTNVLIWVAAYVVSTGIPLVVMILGLWYSNILRSFWFWAVEFGTSYATRLGFGQGLANLIDMGFYVFGPLSWLAPIALAGVAGQASTRLRIAHWPFALGFLVVSFAAVCPGLYFRPHYFLFLFPALALWVGIGADVIARLLRARFRSPWVWGGVPSLLVVFAMAASASGQKLYFFSDSPEQISRRRYGINPFAEAQEIGRFIEANSGPEDTVAILGSEPEILFYARRRSATGYLVTDLLTRPDDLALRMQASMIREIDASDPRFVVFVRVDTSWNLVPGSHMLLIEWFQARRETRYQRVAVVRIDRPRRGRFFYGDELPDVVPGSQWVEVFRRREEVVPESSSR